MIIHQNETCGECQFTPLCESQSDEKKEYFNQSLPIQRQLTLKKGGVLFAPNTPFRSLYAVKTGAIKTVQAEGSGAEFIRNFYFAGEIFGYKALHQGQYLSTAKALCDTVVCEIDYREFLQFIQKNPHLHEYVMYLTCSHINMGSYLNIHSVERKMAAFLLDLLNRLRTGSSKNVLRLPMQRQDIANYLRLTPETVSRIASRFIQNKIIVADKRKITLLKPMLLQSIAEGTTSLTIS